MILEYVAITIFSLFFLSSLVFNLYLLSKHKRFIMVIAQLILDKEVVSEKLNEVSQTPSKEFNDGFLKFLSDSRESAFEYISSVQGSLKNYQIAINSGDGDAITLAQLELFAHLPEETDKV